MEIQKFDANVETKANSLININDMINAKFPLKSIRTQGEIKGFKSIAESRSFKQLHLALLAELKPHGLTLIERQCVLS